MASVEGASLGSWRRLEVAGTAKGADTSQCCARLWEVWRGSFKWSGRFVCPVPCPPSSLGKMAPVTP